MNEESTVRAAGKGWAEEGMGRGREGGRVEGREQLHRYYIAI